MSFTPEFAPDARLQWSALEFDFQEIVLDELERLALRPPIEGQHIVEAISESSALRHYVFLRVWIDHKRSKVTVLGVGHVTHSAP